ncbi:MAG: type II secretion system GspH family protein [Calditerrivibrio sp.]|nr:type II secretion system GspH family protein [Calditerrivibrio sp.]
MKKGFTLIEIVSSILIFVLFMSVIYMIFSRNMKEQLEIKESILSLNFFKMKYYNIPLSDEYKSMNMEKRNEGELFGKKEFYYEIRINDKPTISVYAIE